MSFGRLAGRMICIRVFCLALVSLTITVPAVAQLKASEQGADFDRARQLLAEGDLDQALSDVKRGLAQTPHSVFGLNLLGVIYNQQGKHEEARAQFEQALIIAPGSVETLVNLATTLEAQNKAELAVRTLRKALRLQPANETANYNLAVLLLEQNKAKEALPLLLRIKSPDLTAQLMTIRAYLGSDMPAEGVAAAEKLSRTFATDTRVHFSLGVLLASHRQYQEASHEFEKADALQPANFEILHDLGEAYLLSGQLAKAQESLNEALRLQPDSAETLYLLAETAAGIGKEVDALELLIRARNLAPNDTNILFLMAQLSMKQSFFEDAIELLNKGLKIDPRRAEFHAALGESYFTVGKTDKALEEFKTLVSIDPSPRSYVFMGLCYRHLGKFDEAKDYLKKSLSADPNNVPALFNSGFIARKERDYPAAEKYLQRAVELDGNYPEALFELGSLRMDEKKYEEALPLFRHFVEVTANPTQGYYKLAICERNLHQQEAAERDMNIFKTLSKSPQPAPYPLQHFFDYLQRRSTLSEEQQNEADLRDLELEVGQHPDRPRSLYLLAETLLKLGRTKDALQTLQRLDAISGADFRTEMSTGVLLGRFHLYADAIGYFQTALKINPESDDAKYNLAEAEFQSGNYENALKSLLQVSENGRKESSYLGLIGDVDSQLGHYEDASNCLRQAITASPDKDQYYVSLAFIQLRAGDLDGADRVARTGLARIPDSGLLYWAAGVVAVARGQARDAEKLLTKASELSPSGEAIVATLGMFYYEEGRFSEAREVLRRCEEMFPQGTLDFEKIDAVLDAASNSGSQKPPESIPPEARKEFYELALSMRDRER